MKRTKEYAERAKEEIDQMANEIEKIRSLAGDSLAALRSEYDKRISEISVRYDREIRNLDEQLQAVEGQADSMKNASGRALEELGIGVDAAIAEMKDAISRARREFHQH